MTLKKKKSNQNLTCSTCSSLIFFSCFMLSSLCIRVFIKNMSIIKGRSRTSYLLVVCSVLSTLHIRVAGFEQTPILLHVPSFVLRPLLSFDFLALFSTYKK